MIASLAFWLGSLAFVPDGVSINGRLEAERPPVSVEPPSGGRVATFVPIYGTRPCCLVLAITRHSCPDPDLDS